MTVMVARPSRLTSPAARQCEHRDGTAKRTFATRAEAIAARRTLNGSHVKVYRCDVHSGWHLGRNPERRRS